MLRRAARWRSQLLARPGAQRALALMGPSGLVAVVAGSVTIDLAPQPQPYSTALGLAASLIAFVLVYVSVGRVDRLIAPPARSDLSGETPDRRSAEPRRGDRRL